MVHERPLLRIVSANQAHHKDPKSPRCPEATKFIHRSLTVDPGKVIHDRSGVLLALSGPRRGPARALWRCDPCRLNSGEKGLLVDRRLSDPAVSLAILGR